MYNLEQIDCGENADDEHAQADCDPEAETPFDDLASLWAIPAEQERLEIEPQPARHEGTHDEKPDIIAGKSHRDGDELIGYRRDAFAQNDQGAPTRYRLADG